MPDPLPLDQIINKLQTQWGGDDEGETKSWFKTEVKYGLYTSYNPTLDLLGYKTLTASQQSFAREAFELWDDLIAISLTETSNLGNADIALAYSDSLEGTRSHTVVGSDSELGSVKVVLNSSNPNLQDGTLDYGVSGTILHERQ